MGSKYSVLHGFGLEARHFWIFSEIDVHVYVHCVGHVVGRCGLVVSV